MSNEELKVGEVLNLSGLLQFCEQNCLVLCNDTSASSDFLLKHESNDGEIVYELDWSDSEKRWFIVRYVL